MNGGDVWCDHGRRIGDPILAALAGSSSEAAACRSAAASCRCCARRKQRIAPVIPPERTFVVTSEALAEQTRAELPELPPENVLAEPVGRNTAPCVGWAASVIARTDPEAR